MQKICESGFKISNVDKKALEEFLIITPFEWARNALNGMINKSIKILLKDYYELYKSKQENFVSTELNIIIPDILTMPEFKRYKILTPPSPQIIRIEQLDIEILPNGFDIEDHEYSALNVYYDNAEDYLNYLIENKIYRRRKAFVEQYIDEKLKDPNTTSIPVKEDDFINLITNESGYKNRAEREI